MDDQTLWELSGECLGDDCTPSPPKLHLHLVHPRAFASAIDPRNVNKPDDVEADFFHNHQAAMTRDADDHHDPSAAPQVKEGKEENPKPSRSVSSLNTQLLAHGYAKRPLKLDRLSDNEQVHVANVITELLGATVVRLPLPPPILTLFATTALTPDQPLQPRRLERPIPLPRIRA